MDIDGIRSRLIACAQQFDKTPQYAAPDRVVSNAFRSYPRNDDVDIVLLKVTLLDRLYGTNIPGLAPLCQMAAHIRRTDLDSQLGEGHTSAVGSIRSGHGIKRASGKEVDYFSFATKYCHWHRPDVYPMYDAYVLVALQNLKTPLALGGVSEERLRDFIYFRDLVDTCRSRLALDWDGYKRLDQALWIFGMELKSAGNQVTVRSGGERS